MTEVQPATRRHNGKYLAFGMAIGLVATIIVYLVVPVSSGALAALFKHEQRQQLADGIVAVNAGAYQGYQFDVPSYVSNAKIMGKFAASGSSDNDIVVMILSEKGYANWRNGHLDSNYYFSGKTTGGDIDVNVPSGESLYLIFDNTFSATFSKSVEVSVMLSYTQ